MKQTLKSFTSTVSIDFAKDAAIGITASLALALCAPFTIHLPFTPVPVTIQVQVALFLGAIMGPRKGVWMILAFLAQGLMGWPVFAGGASTIATIIGPRGGYLFGYLIAAYVVGKIYQSSQNKSTLSLFFSMLIGNLIVYFCGFSWLSVLVGIKKAFIIGIFPFMLSDLIKLTLIALSFKQGSYLLNFLRKK